MARNSAGRKAGLCPNPAGASRPGPASPGAKPVQGGSPWRSLRQSLNLASCLAGLGGMLRAMTVRTRFAPSPTGLLHIGGARTALFNHLFTRHHGGEYLLRVEDTDRARSTQAAVDVILQGLEWLGLSPDEAPVFQSTRAARHAEVAHAMLESEHAYRCFCTADELREMRERAVGGAPHAALRRALAGPRPGRRAGGGALHHPAARAHRGRDRGARPGAGGGAGRQRRAGRHDRAALGRQPDVPARGGV